jgi:hypothetical protein
MCQVKVSSYDGRYSSKSQSSYTEENNIDYSRT